MPSIHLERVSFAYADAVPILQDVELHLPSGWTALVGENGAGKTTLLRLVAGELQPDRGHVRLEPALASVLLCPQGVERPGPEIAALAASEQRTSQRLRGALDLVPATLDRWESLSPGERKRWQIGAALAAEPDVLLLDEPTNHVDAVARDLLAGALRAFTGVGVLVSHDRALLEALTERTVRVERGTLRLHRLSYGAARAYAWLRSCSPRACVRIGRGSELGAARWRGLRAALWIPAPGAGEDRPVRGGSRSSRVLSRLCSGAERSRAPRLRRERASRLSRLRNPGPRFCSGPLSRLCGFERLVAFSCKGSSCPSCTTRRMEDTAAHLAENVIQEIPVRQWVLSLPRHLRFLAARQPKVASQVLSIFTRAVFSWLRRAARRMGVKGPGAGAVTVVQRFGSSLNLNVHFHTLVPDGVFDLSQDPVCFVPAPRPRSEDLEPSSAPCAVPSSAP